jgi:uncharacterized protein (DUF1501 family)
MSLTRRRFLTITGGAAAAGGAAWAGLLRAHVESARAPTTTTARRKAEHMLVVVQLSGGNDGLNTLVPVGDGRYYDARPTLAVPENEVVAIANETAFGLHPSLAALTPRWNAGHMAALEAIGYENSSRSHFAALDSWWRGAPDTSSTSGWLGRWLDATGVGDGNPLAAISLGAGSPALRAAHTYSTAITTLDAFTLLAPDGVVPDALIDALLATAEPVVPEPTLAYAQHAATAAVDAVRTLSGARAVVAPPSAAQDDTEFGTTNGPGPITEGLAVAANLLSLDLGTRVVLVAGNGFDTHSGQAADHPALLADLASGITAFFDAIESHGLTDEVLLITTSEFGRCVAENGSAGTDHGAGGVQFVTGSAVRGGIVGQPDLGVLDDGDVRATLDVRSLYAVALDWLDGPTDDVLGGAFDRYALVG